MGIYFNYMSPSIAAAGVLCGGLSALVTVYIATSSMRSLAHYRKDGFRKTALGPSDRSCQNVRLAITKGAWLAAATMPATTARGLMDIATNGRGFMDIRNELPKLIGATGAYVST